MVETLAASGIPFPEVNALVIAIIEFAGGGFLAIGLLTPICAAFLGGDMLGRHLHESFKERARGYVLHLAGQLSLSTRGPLRADSRLAADGGARET